MHFARRPLELILSRYPSTAAASRARELLQEVAAEMASKKSAREASARETADEGGISEFDRKRIRAHLDRAEEAGPKIVHGVSGETRRLRQRIGHLDAARSLLDKFGEHAGPDVLSLREEVRRGLVRSYLDLGQVYLVRLSLPLAASECEKACDLDPENAESHALHGKILDAWLATGYGPIPHLGGGR